MNADLTFNSVVFKKSFDSPDLSLRQSTARAINTPDTMTIRSQDYVDSKSKISGRRHSVRVGRTFLDANLVLGEVSWNLTAQVAGNASNTDITTSLATLKAAVADADLLTNVLNNEK